MPSSEAHAVESKKGRAVGVEKSPVSMSLRATMLDAGANLVLLS